MRNYTAVIERDADTGLFVGYVPGWPGAHSQGSTVDELLANLAEVVEMLLEPQRIDFPDSGERQAQRGPLGLVVVDLATLGFAAAEVRR